MNVNTSWFIIGLVFVALLSMYVPRIAGVVVVLLALVLAIEASQKGLLAKSNP